MIEDDHDLIEDVVIEEKPVILPNSVFNMDCLEGLKLMESDSVDFCLTDPPYEVDYHKKSMEMQKVYRFDGRGGLCEGNVERDKDLIDVGVPYDELARELYRVMKKDTITYFFCGNQQIAKWITSMTTAGFKNFQVLTWKKQKTTFDMTFGHQFKWNSEFVLLFHKGWKKLNGWEVERHRFKTVLEFDAPFDSDHACAKPMDLLTFLTKTGSQTGDLCLDLYMGSGNHVVVFKRLKREFIGFEISSVYYKKIQQRLREENKQIELSDWE